MIQIYLIRIEITVEEKSATLYHPSAHAQELIFSNTPITGKIEKDITENVYYFDVKLSCKIVITVSNLNKARLNRLLYSDKDSTNYVTYPKVVAITKRLMSDLKRLSISSSLIESYVES